MLIYVIAIAVIFIGLGFLFRIILGSPIKYAIKIEDIESYENFILVKQTWHTGTGWQKVGADFGFLNDIEYYDVNLIGTVPPLIGTGVYANTFLCIVEYLGNEYETNFDGDYEKYFVLDWYPLYPVKRDTILPSWLFPKGYMTKRDIN